MTLKSTTVLITGADSFIGSHLTEALVTLSQKRKMIFQQPVKT